MLKVIRNTPAVRSGLEDLLASSSANKDVNYPVGGDLRSIGDVVSSGILGVRETETQASFLRKAGDDFESDIINDSSSINSGVTSKVNNSSNINEKTSNPSYVRGWFQATVVEEICKVITGRSF